MQRTTVTSNPYAIEAQIQRSKNKPLIDLYTERRMREQGQTPKADIDTTEALDNSELIDLYQERKLRRP